MNNTRIIFYLLFLCYAPIFSFQLSDEAEHQLDLFTKTNIVFTRAGTTAFIQNCLNSSLYNRLFLPSCFDHLIDFLEFGKSLSHHTAFNAEVFALFHQQLKQTSWVNAFALVRLLDKLPTLIDAQTTPAATKDSIKKTIQTLLENPDVSLDMLAEELVHVYAETTASHELHATLLRFLEQACDKLIWSPEDKEVTWECCALIGNQLEKLYHAGLIPSSRKLNALYWSLVTRYAYFIETNITELDAQTIESIAHDMQTKTPLWLLITESEESLRTKKEYLEQVMLEASFELHATRA